MRIAFATSVLHRQRSTGQLDGIGRYAGELLAALGRCSDCTLREYVHPDIAGAAVPGALAAGSFHRQVLGALAANFSFRSAERALGAAAGLVHATDHFIPRLCGIPVVATIHDAVPLSHPEWNSYRWPKLRGLLWKRTARWADAIITVSEHAQREIAGQFDRPPQNIHVTPPGVAESWFGETNAIERARVRALYRLPKEYFIFLGVMQPRKNLARLIAAHRRLPVALRHRHPLVVAGPHGWGCAEESAMLADGDGGTLRCIGPVRETDLLALLQGATALVLPSLHEGFGLPVLEAFAAGTPVAASSAGAIPETAGGAAALFDPRDVREIAETMQSIAENQSKAAELRARGRERARRLTWRRTAELTLAVYREVSARRKV